MPLQSSFASDSRRSPCSEGKPARSERSAACEAVPANRNPLLVCTGFASHRPLSGQSSSLHSYVQITFRPARFTCRSENVWNQVVSVKRLAVFIGRKLYLSLSPFT